MTTNVRESEFEFIQGLTADLSEAELIFPTSLKATMNIKYVISQGNMPEDRLARVISTEPVLFAQVLKLSNSAELNPSGKITTEAATALKRLGVLQVKNLALAVGTKQFNEHKELASDVSQLMDGLWIRSLRVATLSLVIARKMARLNADNALLAGLLHDVGKFYILNRAKHYEALFTSLQALWDMVDAWHSNIGAAILENWTVPDEIRHAVQNFNNPDYVHRGAIDLTEVLIAANLLDAHFENIPNRKINWDSPPPVLQHLALDAAKSEELRQASKVELDLLLSSVS
jgi:putative nucleotidyltransferase with HDIG domain